MKATAASALLGALSALSVRIVGAAPAPTVDESYPYTGPTVPIGDWIDPTINGNGKGFPRLVEPPAVVPASSNPTNNINVIALSYIPQGINIHYQTPFGLGVAPSVSWGTSPTALHSQASGISHTYDRTPPCAAVSVTQCSQFFHEVQISDLEPDTTYYYKIPAANGTTASDVLSFTTSRAAGDPTEFTIAVLNDMGYTNAAGTYEQLLKAAGEGVAFAWHGGDLSYADDWYSGILPCEDDWPICYNGSSTEIPPGDTPPDYYDPLPAGEVANQGGPLGGDLSVLYESNWDLWQQWINNLTAKIPYMVLPGNHEVTCSEFDGPGNILTAYLNSNITNGTAAKSDLTYFSCPPSQRNFTAFQQRFRMPGAETGGVGNFWYSFDYGLAHFVALESETDYANSPSWPFARDVTGNETSPTESETYVTDAGPMGPLHGSYKDTTAYAQYQWLAEDLAKVDRTKTPWLVVMSHRPMYSSQVSSYQKYLREAFEALLLKYGVDIYLSGHIHWYERLFPLGINGTIDTPSVINNNTYYTNPGVSMTHLINGAAGNIESHSTLDPGEGTLNITAYLDQTHYGFGKLNVINATALKWKFVRGDGGIIGDELTLLKKPGKSGGGNGTSSSSSSSSVGPTSSTTSSSSSAGSTSSASGTGSSATISSSSVGPTSSASVTGSSASVSSKTSYSITDCPYVTTKVVTSYTTYCPSATTFTEGSSTYTVTEATTLTITNCPCTLTYTTTGPTTIPYTPTSVPTSALAVSAPSTTSVSLPAESSPVPTSALAVSAPSTALLPLPTESAPIGTSLLSLPAESTPAGTAAATSSVGNTISLTASIPSVGSPTVSSTPASFTGSANRVKAASYAGLAGIIGVVGFVL